MTPDDFLHRLQQHTVDFAKAVATAEGDWIIKGFIDIYKRIYTVSIDTKIVSKVLEILLTPMLDEFATKHGLRMELCPEQNWYPDLTFTDKVSGNRFAVDIKSTYRRDSGAYGMTLGAFSGYFRNRESTKNAHYPYGSYKAHLVLGVIYSQGDIPPDSLKSFTLDDLQTIPSVIRDFKFFVQPKYRIANYLPGSGNTKNIGSVSDLDKLINGKGPFADLGEEVYDDYWMFYLTKKDSKELRIPQPYKNLKTYLTYKQRGLSVLEEHAEQIKNLPDDEEPTETE